MVLSVLPRTLKSFNLDEQIDSLDKQDILYLLIQKFAGIDLHPTVVPNTEMGSIFEELIRKFSEQSNETAGEHFTPREVVRLMVDLLLTDDADILAKGSVIKTMLDPACGTGGMVIRRRGAAPRTLIQRRSWSRSEKR